MTDLFGLERFKESKKVKAMFRTFVGIQEQRQEQL